MLRKMISVVALLLATATGGYADDGPPAVDRLSVPRVLMWDGSIFWISVDALNNPALAKLGKTQTEGIRSFRAYLRHKYPRGYDCVERQSTPSEGQGLPNIMADPSLHAERVVVGTVVAVEPGWDLVDGSEPRDLVVVRVDEDLREPGDRVPSPVVVNYVDTGGTVALDGITYCSTRAAGQFSPRVGDRLLVPGTPNTEGNMSVVSQWVFRVENDRVLPPASGEFGSQPMDLSELRLLVSARPRREQRPSADPHSGLQGAPD